ncbi:anhydro-N-acetylmuramic acid kinase [Evansella vedderi]|uniref:Anhydro-N-acetylmuramic acid kinase n=1 Tax=Evansella vedderi TaxID=38282 RepID=A0ABT9ZZI0_9BACI|nr:anhydro-N-acetylmuramic acid kinase [Evansella vedderi]MDQ0256649.1 anhydro-N-acetylmuramic acid kinase [Evansella vedderi]
MTKLHLPLEKESVLAVGLMSGTSVDGIDAALVKINGSGFETEVELIHFETVNYDNALKERIFKVCEPKTSSVDEVCRLNVVLGEKMAEAAIKVVTEAGLSLGDVDFVSSHGQTIYHLPDEAATLQIGELAVIAKKTGCVTVGDFRPSDMAVGGQGAPLVPFVDMVLFTSAKKGRVLVNIGGMGNLTVLPKGLEQGADILAFDTGPGNVLIDEVVRLGTNGAKAFDNGGELAEAGEIKEKWLAEMVNGDSYLTQPFPKSTGREYYNKGMAEKLWKEGQDKGYSFEDIIATVTAYTVRSISYTIVEQLDPHFNGELDEVLIGGGGVHNRFLMERLEKELGRPVMSMEEVGFSSDAKEAIAFAILGNEFLRQQPNNVPSATGASKLVSMGKLVLPI